MISQEALNLVISIIEASVRITVIICFRVTLITDKQTNGHGRIHDLLDGGNNETVK